MGATSSAWQPIETFNYAHEEARQRTMFVWALVTDGVQVVPATYYEAPGEGGWRDETRQDYGGPEWLGFKPTHWMPLPEPPQ